MEIKRGLKIRQKKQFTHNKMSLTKEPETVVKEEETKTKNKKRRRLIIRNLSFKVGEKELKEVFSKFGSVIDVNIPLKNDGKKRGFGFVEFDSTISLIKAMKTMNYKEIHGRKVAIDYAVSKDRYTNENKSNVKEEPFEVDKVEIKEEDDESVDEIETEPKEEPEKRDEKLTKVDHFMRNFDGDQENDDEISEEDSSDDEDMNEDNSQSESDDEDSKHSDVDNNQKPSNKLSSKTQHNKKQSQDVSEGRTVFIRNLSYATDQDSLLETMEKYGETDYCLLCIDRFTDQPKGSGFVKFKKKSSAEKLIEEAANDPGLVLDGRRLYCDFAISRDKAVDQERSKDEKKPKDKRNLYLLKVGVIVADTPESEGISKVDMAKRMQLEVIRRQKLRNVNFFVSPTRLAVHNLPKNMTDFKLRKLFQKAGGSGAIVREARIMKELKKSDLKGQPLSKGFGFVNFSQPEHALNAVNELNNNPSTFIPNKRPIVEFSIENKVALLSKEKRREKFLLRNKKRNETKESKKVENVKNSKSSEKKKAHSENPNDQEKTTKSAKKKKSKATKKFQKQKVESEKNLKSLTDLKQMYKDKLCKI